MVDHEDEANRSGPSERGDSGAAAKTATRGSFIVFERFPFEMSEPVRQLSRFLSGFRGLFMPLGLLALIALGVHAAADVVDDALLRWVEGADAWLDTVLARSELTAAWVNLIESRERTVLARGVALGWELLVDVFLGVPAFSYGEQAAPGLRFSLKAPETWVVLLRRLAARPTPMRVLRPLATAVFVVGGAYTVSRLVEATLFLGLVPDVAAVDVAQVLARIGGVVSLVVVVWSLGWRAVLRALEHADEVCEAQMTWRQRLVVGTWGTVLATPLAVAMALHARPLLSVFL